MKPFDLEAAKRGEPIVTRDGGKARFIAYVPEARDGYKVVAYVDSAGNVRSYHENGCYIDCGEDDSDLFMASPPMRSINGHEYPDPASETTAIGKKCFIPSITSYHGSLVMSLNCDGSFVEKTLIKRGLIHLTQEAAEAHARAIILAGGGEV